MHLRDIRALAAVSGGDVAIGVMCTLRGSWATEKAAQFGLFLMCRLRFEECQPKDFQRRPLGVPLDISPPLNLTSVQTPTRLGKFDH